MVGRHGRAYRAAPWGVSGTNTRLQTLARGGSTRDVASLHSPRRVSAGHLFDVNFVAQCLQSCHGPVCRPLPLAFIQLVVRSLSINTIRAGAGAEG